MSMHIGVIGNGAFGSAITHLLVQNEHSPECVGIGEQFQHTCDVVVVAVPTQFIRGALTERLASFTSDTLFVNCAKGIEKGTGQLPHMIVPEVTGSDRYAVLGGPSFADEIKRDVPTVVNIATTEKADAQLLQDLLGHDTFVIEPIKEVLGLELAGAMKNVYAVAAGYIGGSGGGENTIAHMQVVALREYTKLVHVLEGDEDVVRPSVVGDLILTCASEVSRNYRYGLSCAQGACVPEETAEGAHTAEAIIVLAEQYGVELPLARAILEVVEEKPDAHPHLYQALGFTL